ncbi:alkyl hydroperoxide reductase [Formosa agariphila KMM 3901]|uniref:thioredoxin-dependent peroxiredoxin n=1 Tax=Formosa agariphila (strain DSM 15362 / KCTC 12365 / LMG 23005 / KMM 3901 / M-2Alg 35-1) TaxID=1347342 RepID=T2KPR7_FORAG|nr:peroxiredoxin-like family protein [Formosa agariphila]CDF80456.1 alkyl hydroperoxide reductase [Formosa agariphila KMM 3901]
MSALKEFQKLVIANATDAKGIPVGDKAPDFTLPNALGVDVSLSELLKTYTVIVKFYRGEWCPICNLDLREIQKSLPQIKALNATVLAVSPQSADDSLTAKEKNALQFEVLSDAKQEVIKAYNLQFDPGEDYHSRRDLNLLNADGSKTLPVPATFIINKTGVIVGSHVDSNYTERMHPQDIIAVLETL